MHAIRSINADVVYHAICSIYSLYVNVNVVGSISGWN